MTQELTHLHSEWSKLYGVLAVLSAIGLKLNCYNKTCSIFYNFVYIDICVKKFGENIPVSIQYLLQQSVALKYGTVLQILFSLHFLYVS